MDPQQLAFALASRRFFQGAQWIARLPGPQIRLSRLWGKRASPYAPDRETLSRSFQLGLGVGEVQGQHHSDQWLASDGLFGTSLFAYHRMDAAWMQRHVQVHEPDVLQVLKSHGGLVLGYHTHHQNTMAIMLGQCVGTTWPVAATEKGSPLAPYTGRFMRIINGQSEAKFAGGRYLFTDEPRQLLRGLRSAFENRHIVLSLCDNPTPANEFPPVHFLGRRFFVGAGVIEKAIEHHAPITLFLFYPDLQGGYHLRLKSLPPEASVPQVQQSYFDFLADTVRQHPWAWQGWHWYGGLPMAEPSAAP